MPLTDAKIRAAKPTGKAFKMPDGGGLHLFMSPTGVRSWRYRYEREGREQTAVLGRYPEMSLADARRARDDTRSQQRSGQAAVPAASHTFEMGAREWHDLNKPRWKPQHAADVLGVGTVSSGSPDTLSRDTILGNSLGTTAKINFSGALTIVCDIPAERSLWASAAGDALLVNNRRLYGVATGTDPSDAPRLDQVGSMRKSTIAVAGGVFLIPIPPLTPGDTNQVIQIDLRSVVCSANTSYYFRLSIDGATSFLSGTSEYKYSLLTSSDGGVAENRGATTYSPFTAVLDHLSAMSGQMYFDPVTHQWNSIFVGINAATGNYVHSIAAGSSATNVPPTHMVIGAAGQNLTGGQARLLQKGF